jgi:hypothetical protein
MLKVEKQFLVASLDAFDLHQKKLLVAGRAATMQKGIFIPPGRESPDSRINNGAH